MSPIISFSRASGSPPTKSTVHRLNHRNPTNTHRSPLISPLERVSQFFPATESSKLLQIMNKPCHSPESVDSLSCVDGTVRMLESLACVMHPSHLLSSLALSRVLIDLACSGRPVLAPDQHLSRSEAGHTTVLVDQYLRSHRPDF